jgi:hypothetical protein
VRNTVAVKEAVEERAGSRRIEAEMRGSSIDWFAVVAVVDSFAVVTVETSAVGIVAPTAAGRAGTVVVVDRCVADFVETAAVS